MNKESSPLAKILFTVVLTLVLVLNAAMTAVFGYTYLPGAFGGSGILPQVAGALYALLILDAAALAYLNTYVSSAETKWQRTTTLLVGTLCLAGSIFATVVQLTNSAFGLTVLVQYQQTIETIALIMIIALTAVHAIVVYFYRLMGSGEQAKQKAIDIKAGVTAEALRDLEARMLDDSARLAASMSEDMRKQVLHTLGFSEDLEPALRERKRGEGDQRPS
jgi:hypothetical protein